MTANAAREYAQNTSSIVVSRHDNVKAGYPMEDFVSAYLQYMRQPAFWWGGISILFFVFGFLWLMGRVVAAWNTVLQFFSPTRETERNKPGPSPFKRLTGCLFSLFFLLLILGGLAIIVFRAFQM